MLNKNNVTYKGELLTDKILNNVFSPALLDLYITAYTNVQKIDSQYTFIACALGINGLPKEYDSYSQYVGISSNINIIDETLLSKEEARIKRNRNNLFKNYVSDTMENNIHILKWCITSFDDPTIYLTQAQINSCKSELSIADLGTLQDIEKVFHEVESETIIKKDE